jgi:CRISPR-associated protein Cmr4
MLKDYTVDLYTFTTLTNLHAGAGDANYGIVDKEVQKDPLDLLPIVHASGLKGAFRELFAHHKGGHDANDVVDIFGSDTSARKKKANDFKSGSHLFYDARLLCIPVRSNYLPFFRATSPELMREFYGYCKDVGHSKALDTEKSIEDFLNDIKVNNQPHKPSEGNPLVFNLQENTTVILENLKAKNATVDNSKLQNVEKLFGSNLALMVHQDLKRLCKSLPVIARNQLENGMSKNLWYEEVVPRETKFYTFVSHAASDTKFENTIKNGNINGLVQIGGNATIGYGQCKFAKH